MTPLRCRGVEVEVCKARLGLARVSVVRGEGAAAGSPAIDDYIRSLEPISDYLTKWSGLVSCIAPSLPSLLGWLTFFHDCLRNR